MNSGKTQRLTGLALFTAIIVVLQVIATFVRFGPFSITLSLIPIVAGAAIYGPKAGAYLGGVFGVVVLVACILGWDAGGAILWNANPFLTAVICLAKGILAGFAAGGVFTLISGKQLTTGRSLVGTVCAAVVSPVVNAGLFILALYLLFPDILAAWASDFGAEVTTYILTGLVGINFLVELAVNVVLSPVVVQIIRARATMNPRRA